jgi:hypothetical protein
MLVSVRISNFTAKLSVFMETLVYWRSNKNSPEQAKSNLHFHFVFLCLSFCKYFSFRVLGPKDFQPKFYTNLSFLLPVQYIPPISSYLIQTSVNIRWKVATRYESLNYRRLSFFTLSPFAYPRCYFSVTRSINVLTAAMTEAAAQSHRLAPPFCLREQVKASRGVTLRNYTGTLHAVSIYAAINRDATPRIMTVTCISFSRVTLNEVSVCSLSSSFSHILEETKLRSVYVIGEITVLCFKRSVDEKYGLYFLSRL